MAEPAAASQSARLTILILLAEPLDRRLARWAEMMPGASWPAWGGHITLISSFEPSIPVEEVLRRVIAVGQMHQPFAMRLRAPMAVQDVTRPQYHAVFLTVDDDDHEHHDPLRALREDLLAALVDVRLNVRPELKLLSFLPHITLALSLAKEEADLLVRTIRANPLEAEFEVEAIWVIEQMPVDGLESKVERHAIALGKARPPELLANAPY